MTLGEGARSMTEGWITDIEIRQPAIMSHEVAYANVLDLAARLVAEGWDVTLRPTLPDIPKDTRSAAWDDAGDPL